MHVGVFLSLEKFFQKYEARIYSNYIKKHQIFMLITGRRRKRRSYSPRNSSN